MPLKVCNLGNFYEDPVSRVVLEVIRLLDDQLCDPGKVVQHVCNLLDLYDEVSHVIITWMGERFLV